MYLPPGDPRIALRNAFRSPDLTPREHQILTLITQGLNNRDIAKVLNIADKTVRIHVSSVLDKMNARDRTQAAIYAIQHGIVHLP